MIFDSTKIGFRFIDVIGGKENKKYVHNKPRSFCALSYRLNSHSIMRYGGKEIELKTNDITFVPANLEYDRYTDYEEFLCIHFEVFNDTTSEICKFTPKNPEKLKSLFYEAYKLANSTAAKTNYKGSAILNEIFALIIEEISYEKQYSPNFLAAKKYLDENYTNPQLTISMAASEVGMSEVHIRRLFHSEMNMSPKKYLTSVRIKQARSLISSGNYSIAQIAEMVGFYDEKYFSQVFRNYTASTPSQYRENDINVKRLFGKQPETETKKKK